LLPRLFDEIWVPSAVAHELVRAQTLLPSTPAFRVQSPSNSALVRKLQSTLDLAESEALALAIEIGADAVLIDEAEGRAVAVNLGLKPRGALGILVNAKQLGLIPSVAPLIARLRDEINFRMSADLIRDILQAAGE
jgi:uncharacterized protein